MKLTTGLRAWQKLFVSSRAFCAVSFVALGLFMTPIAADAAMLDIGGIFGGAQSNDASFVLVGGFTTQSDVDDLLPVDIATPNVTDLTIDLSNFTVDGGEIGISTFQLKGRGGGSANLHVTNATLTQVLTSPVSIAYIVADVELNPLPLSNTTLADLSDFIEGGSLIITLNGVNVSPGPNGGSVDLSRGGATASFTLTTIPEPSTFVLAALAIVSLLGLGRRRRR